MSTKEAARENQTFHVALGSESWYQGVRQQWDSASPRVVTSKDLAATPQPSTAHLLGLSCCRDVPCGLPTPTGLASSPCSHDRVTNRMGSWAERAWTAPARGLERGPCRRSPVPGAGGGTTGH